jgi:hypothetical protein
MTELDLEDLLYSALKPMPCTCRRAHYNGPVVVKCRRCVACAAYELKVAQRSIVQTPANLAKVTRAALAQANGAEARDPDEVGEVSRDG